jgi:hypothetical protein
MSSDLIDATGAAGAEKVVVEAAPTVSDVAGLTAWLVVETGENVATTGVEVATVIVEVAAVGAELAVALP